MLRRRGSAPAVVLQQQFSENRGVLFRPDRSFQSTETPKVSKIKRGKKELERSCSPPSCYYEAPDKRANDTQQGLDCDSTSPKCPSPVSPGSPNTSIKAVKQRQKRKECEQLGTQLLLRDATARNSSVSSALHRQSNSFRDFNIVLLGQGGVGKSALLVRFMTGRFIHEYDPSLEMTYEKCAEIDDEPAVLHITDTANTHEPVYLSQNEGFIVVYAIDDARTFQTAKQLIKLIRELKKQKGQQTSIVLVGNKVDLNHSRAVAKKEASEFASEYECFFQETSAATNVKVKTVFYDAVRQLRVFQLNKKTNGAMNSIKNFFSR